MTGKYIESYDRMLSKVPMDKHLEEIANVMKKNWKASLLPKLGFNDDDLRHMHQIEPVHQK